MSYAVQLQAAYQMSWLFGFRTDEACLECAELLLTLEVPQ